MFSLLSSGKTLRSWKCRANRLRNSFSPWFIKLLNSKQLKTWTYSVTFKDSNNYVQSSDHIYWFLFHFIYLPHCLYLASFALLLNVVILLLIACFLVTAIYIFIMPPWIMTIKLFYSMVKDTTQLTSGRFGPPAVMSRVAWLLSPTLIIEWTHKKSCFYDKWAE